MSVSVTCDVKSVSVTCGGGCFAASGELPRNSMGFRFEILYDKDIHMFGSRKTSCGIAARHLNPKPSIHISSIITSQTFHHQPSSDIITIIITRDVSQTLLTHTLQFKKKNVSGYDMNRGVTDDILCEHGKLNTDASERRVVPREVCDVSNLCLASCRGGGL